MLRNVVLYSVGCKSFNFTPDEKNPNALGPDEENRFEELHSSVLIRRLGVSEAPHSTHSKKKSTSTRIDWKEQRTELVNTTRLTIPIPANRSTNSFERTTSSVHLRQVPTHSDPKSSKCPEGASHAAKKDHVKNNTWRAQNTGSEAIFL